MNFKPTFEEILKEAIKENREVLQSLQNHDSGKKVISTDRIEQDFARIQRDTQD